MKTILSQLYKRVIDKRNMNFDCGKIEFIQLPLPVFSVGNINIGGTGKTPFCILLAEFLLSQGKYPGIIGKGYRRKRKQISIISNGEQIIANIDDAGDEMYMLARKVKVPVVVNSRKYIAAQIAHNSFNIDSIIVDDGFQHRKLKRDIDILMLNDKAFEYNKLIPLGSLREELSAISRADLIVTPVNFNNIDNLRQYSNSPIIIIRKTIDKYYEINTKNYMIFSELNTFDKPFALLSAIATPIEFENHFRNIMVNSHFRFRDHHNYSINDVEQIIRNCQKNSITAIFTTEKDAVKLDKFKSEFAESNILLYVCILNTEIINGLEHLKRLTDEAFQKYYG